MKQKLDFWKPRKDNKGAAAIFDWSEKNTCFFLTMMPQKGEKAFDSDKSLRIKLGRNDIGEILAVLRGRIGGVGTKDGSSYKGLYHKSGQGDDSSILSFAQYNDQEGNDRGFSLGLSVKRGGNASRLSIGITHGEAEQMISFLATGLTHMFADEYTPQAENAAA